MPERKPLMLRLDPATLDALRGWAADELRSLNAQIEFVLRRALREAGRLPAAAASAAALAPADEPGPMSDARTELETPADYVRTRREDMSPAQVEP